MYNKMRSVLRWRKVLVSGNRTLAFFRGGTMDSIHGHEVLK